MMSCTHANIFLPNVKNGFAYCPSRSSYFYPSRLNVSALCKGDSYKAFYRLVSSQSKCRRFDPICSATGNSERENKGFSWESSKKGMGGMGQELSMHDLLTEKMRRQQFGGNGGDGSPPGGRSGDGSGDQEDQNLPAIMDEVLQVVLATIGFILVYTYLLSGAELTRLARDYIKYLLRGTASPRLLRTMENWGEFNESIIRMIDIQKGWVGRAFVAAPILWQNLRKLVELMRPGDS